MNAHQSVHHIARICAEKGVEDAIIAPGSRNAPLSLSFYRSRSIRSRVINDERSAGYIALGIAQYTGKPVVLICTSGTAVLNFYPAIAEAYMRDIPLLVFTADRPDEWVGQHDNQTIYQQGVFANHILRSWQFPVDTSHPDAQWHAERMTSEAINLAVHRGGPVHINVPLREPLYDENTRSSQKPKVIDIVPTSPGIEKDVWTSLVAAFKKYRRVVLACGQLAPDKELFRQVNNFSIKTGIPVLTEVTSNLRHIKESIRHHDLFLGTKEHKALQPDLLLTIGDHFLSKNLKKFIRSSKATDHWHIGGGITPPDTFQRLTRSIPVSPAWFIRKLTRSQPVNVTSSYRAGWLQQEQHAATLLGKLPADPFNEFYAIREVLAGCPKNAIIHLANSMPVRYANFLPADNHFTVFANRGTSGIDGCISTAVGTALSSRELNIVLTGDMAFFYDRNALWHEHLPDNLRIVLLNNHGGGIFRMIDGPARQKELETLFVARQRLNGAHTAADFGLDYACCRTAGELQKHLPALLNKKKKAGILEIITDGKTNTKVLKGMKGL